MGCLYLEIEGHSWLVDNLDRDLAKTEELRRLTKKDQKLSFRPLFPHSDGPKIS